MFSCDHSDPFTRMHRCFLCIRIISCNEFQTRFFNAVANPADGNWLYFVTVNLDTGETKFTANYDEHMTNVEELKTWIAANTAS